MAEGLFFFKRSKYSLRSRGKVEGNSMAEERELKEPSFGCEGAEEEGERREKNPLECAVCLQTCVLPARLACGHVFCFLCIKGFYQTSGRCALCRTRVPRDYLDAPVLLEGAFYADEVAPDNSADSASDVQYQWFYKGRDGWWKYEQRTNNEIELAHSNGEDVIELLIAGAMYVIDFQSMVQYRKSQAGRQRAIKRDRADSASKGVAGVLEARQLSNDEGSAART